MNDQAWDWKDGLDMVMSAKEAAEHQLRKEDEERRAQEDAERG